MPSKKISQLTAATAPLSTDLHALARSNSNRKLTTAALFNETITLADFTTLLTGSSLIAGRWYRVTGCLTTADQTLLVLATESGQYSRQVILENNSQGPTWCEVVDLNTYVWRQEDGAGNVYHQPHSITGQPILNTTANFIDCTFHNGGAYVNADGSGLRQSCTFGSSSIDFEYIDMQSTTVLASGVTSTIAAGASINHCHIVNSALDFNVDKQGNVLLDCTLEGCALNLEGDSSISLTNCFFKNVNVTVKNGAQVENLTIIGTKTSDGPPQYVIDGAFQSQVLNNWAGSVIVDAHRGSSTVQARVELNGTNDVLTYNDSAKKIWLPTEQTVIGTYLLPEPALNLDIQYITGAPSNTGHSIRIKKLDFLLGFQFTSIFEDYSSMGGADEIITYHGVTPKVGQLTTTSCYVELRAQYAHPIGQNCWTLEYGAHYD